MRNPLPIDYGVVDIYDDAFIYVSVNFDELAKVTGSWEFNIIGAEALVQAELNAADIATDVLDGADNPQITEDSYTWTQTLEDGDKVRIPARFSETGTDYV